MKDQTFKQGKKITHDEMITAIDRLYDKRYTIIPNAKIKGGVEPTHTIINKKPAEIIQQLGPKKK